MDGENPPKFDEEYLENRRDRRKWEQRRQKLLFDYSQFSFYSSSVSSILFMLLKDISYINCYKKKTKQISPFSFSL